MSDSIPTALAAPAEWPTLKRLVFRFALIYLGLFFLTNQILSGLVPVVFLDMNRMATTPPLRSMILWVELTIFGKSVPVGATGSGDTTFDWVTIFCWLILACVGALAWTATTRVKSHPTLYKWFHLFLRLGLGSTILGYGLVKVLPMQMPYPTLNRLLEPYGNFSPMGVLWNSIGASPAYEIFIGLVEVLAGVLVMIPWTGLLGALLALTAAGEVFVLNMTYDIPVKILSFHLVLMAGLILLPDLPRLATVLLTSRAVGPREESPLFASPVKSKWAKIGQVLFALASVAQVATSAHNSGRRQMARRSRRSTVFGISKR